MNPGRLIRYVDHYTTAAQWSTYMTDNQEAHVPAQAACEEIFYQFLVEGSGNPEREKAVDANQQH